jgi:hypothetical protein
MACWQSVLSADAASVAKHWLGPVASDRPCRLRKRRRLNLKLGSNRTGRDDIVEGDGYTAAGGEPFASSRRAQDQTSLVRLTRGPIMRRTILATIATLVIATWASTVSAVFIDTTAHYIKTGYRRNVAWPWPYICPDRAATRDPFEVMIRNGWRRQNLLGNYLFDPATNQLTTAGQLQVRWIMTQAPPTFRQVFIERSIDPSVTAARIAATRDYAQRISLDGQLPQVFETDLMAEGRPANVVDMTNVKFLENMPIPVLPTASASELDQ